MAVPAGEAFLNAMQTGNPWIIAVAGLVIGGYCLYNSIFSKQKEKKEAKHIRRKLEEERKRMLEEERRNGVFSGGPGKDPKSNKKKNEKKPPREYTQKDYKLLNDDDKFTELSLEDRVWLIRNEENIDLRNYYIRREAEKILGYVFYDGVVDFDTHGQAVYRKGNKFITFDIDGHKGGFWKMFRRGVRERIGTFSIDLEIMVGT